MGERGMISRKALSVLLSFLIIICALMFAGVTAFAEENDDTEYTQLDMPVISPVSSTAEGVKISWKAVEGAEWYRVFYKNSAGNWVRIGDTTDTSYIWTGAKSGTNYTFTVRCTNEDGTEYISPYDPDGKSIDYIAAPKISSVANAATGAKITWGKVTGASKYRVFYKNSAGNWVRIGDTTDTSYIWTGAKSGTNYTFTVRCTNEDGTEYISPYDPNGKSIDYIAAPKISSVANAATGAKITWGKVTGASKYRVFYKNSAGNWVKIGDTTDTSYIWTGAKSGTNYTFTVRCTDKDGAEYISSYDPDGKTFYYIAAPQISSVSNTLTGVQIKWKKSAGTDKYRVFYKNSAGNWVRIADTASTSYIWTGAKSGTKYTFTVRCINDKGEYISSYDPDGKTINYIAAPKISSVANAATGAKITWGKVTGASKYRVFYKNSAGNWVRIGDTTSTNYTWTGAKSGTKYTFTVRCINSSGSEYISSYDPTGKSFSYIAAPKITGAASNTTGIQIKWGKVTGVSKYRVFYKNSAGNWVRIADTTSTSYTWTGAKTGTKYTFTVRCINGSGTEYISSYDPNGKTATFNPSLNYKASVAADTYSNCTKYVYGKSAMGYQLEAFIINGTGKNNKIIFMDFAVHGFEDEYAKDGKVLVTLGNGLVEYYSAHPELLGDYKLVIVPCANPDGTMFGKNNYRADKKNPFGRCTSKGIDINRDFKAGSFKAVESKALRNLMNKYNPSIYLNFHGWENSVIGNSQLVSIFLSEVGLKTDKSGNYGSTKGYIIGYVRSTYNAKAAIVEFKNSKSVDQAKVINAINSVISNKL